VFVHIRIEKFENRYVGNIHQVSWTIRENLRWGYNFQSNLAVNESSFHAMSSQGYNIPVRIYNAIKSCNSALMM